MNSNYTLWSLLIFQLYWSKLIEYFSTYAFLGPPSQGQAQGQASEASLGLGLRGSSSAADLQMPITEESEMLGIGAPRKIQAHSIKIIFKNTFRHLITC